MDSAYTVYVYTYLTNVYRCVNTKYRTSVAKLQYILKLIVLLNMNNTAISKIHNLM